MAKSVWTIRHTHYGLGFPFLLATGTIAGTYFDNVTEGIKWGAIAGIVYGLIMIIQWYRRYRVHD